MPTKVVVWLPDRAEKPSEAKLTEAAIARQSIEVAQVTETLADVSFNADTWIWLLTAGSEPKPDALSELLLVAGESTSIGQVGPMLLSNQNPRLITGLGLSISPLGAPVSLVSGQLDQSQHSIPSEVMAVASNGSLTRSDLLERVGVPNFKLPGMATDLDFSIRIRRIGLRVLTAPKAKLLVANPTKKDERRAAIQLRFAHSPLIGVFLYWLLLPAITVIRLGVRLAQKRPGLLLQELFAGLWGFLTFPARLASRQWRATQSLRTLRSLRATWSQTRTHKSHEADAHESQQRLVAFARGDHESAEAAAKTFAEAGGYWFVALMAAASWMLLPQSQALIGPSLLPLSGNWFDVFARAGASWQPIGQGFFGPSDPFNWVLLLFGSFTFWSPNLSIVILLFLARALAFVTAWKALSLLTPKAWHRNLGAAVYALLPAFSVSINRGEIPVIVVTILAPWLAFSIARAAGLGRSGNAASDARTWSWVGLSGVLLALIAAASPAVGLISLLALAVAAFTKIRRFGYLFWVPLPAAAIYLPLVWYLTSQVGEPLAIFANPSLGQATSSSAIDVLVDASNPLNLALAGFAALALAALASSRWVVSMALALFGLASFVLLGFTTSLRLPADIVSAGLGLDRVHNSGGDVAAVVGLVTAALAVNGLSQVRKKALVSLGWLASVSALIPMFFVAVTANPQVEASSGSVVPLLLQKQAEQGTDLQLLKIAKHSDEIRIQWMPIAGVRLEDSNLAYRFSLESIAKGKDYQRLATAIGNLSAANGEADMRALVESKVGYILVEQTAQNAELAAALESSPDLESAGLTPYGQLWRVKGISSADAPKTSRNPWSITKAVQLASLAAFLLLAVPTRPRRKPADDSEIFIDQSESELNV